MSNRRITKKIRRILAYTAVAVLKERQADEYSEFRHRLTLEQRDLVKRVFNQDLRKETDECILEAIRRHPEIEQIIKGNPQGSNISQ